MREGVKVGVAREGVKVGVAREGRRTKVNVCAGTACVFAGSLKVRDAFEEQIAAAGLEDAVEVGIIGCHGLCSQGPLAVVTDGDVYYPRLKIKDVERVVREHLAGGAVVEDLLYVDPATGERVACAHDIAFYKQQTRIALRDVGVIDPEDIEAYLGRGGYEAARRALTELTPEEIIVTVTESGLRGRGGAGFPTGVKWKFARQSPGDVKYLVCNGDEGDPGAFMDASIMDGDPHAVLEGMLIASYAIGAHEGYIYVRAEYPLAVKRLGIAIEAATERGFLGDDALGSGWAFHLHIKEGAGAFVCGEETALMASIKGRRGMPRTRPPFPAVSGLWGKPTNINNVETLANIPWIVEHGAEAYAALGSEKSRGTKAFSLAGKIVNGGLAEVPMGSPLRHVIYDVGGGIKDGREFKAVQLGGPSGGCIPASLLDTPVDYESLAATGAIVGSAAWSWSTTPRAWSTSPSTSCSSPRRRAAASACPAGLAPSACSRSWSASRAAKAKRATSNASRSSPSRSSGRASAASDRRRPTPCSPPSSTSVTSTRRTCASSAARRWPASRSSCTPSTPRPARAARSAPRSARPIASPARRNRRTSST